MFLTAAPALGDYCNNYYYNPGFAQNNFSSSDQFSYQYDYDSTYSLDALELAETEPFFLENTWSFWLYRYVGRNKSLDEYEAALRELGTVVSVQDFWCWYNNLPSVTKVKAGTSYHLMKNGIRPVWEDPANVDGGSFCLRISKKFSCYVWEVLCMMTIGEQFDDALHPNDEVHGISVSVRRSGDDVITIWTKNAFAFDDYKMMAQLSKFMHPDAYSRLKLPIYKVHKNETDFQDSSESSCTDMSLNSSVSDLSFDSSTDLSLDLSDLSLDDNNVLFDSDKEVSFEFSDDSED
eukprot:CAMPEP_0174259858 /NCGR_PEP_ID=MMETSP0439-20130205/8627_1 /TAXON_ID=0 /ORGANISM="Stereomyxa ramosa, Strain Chinc5" /LENGTH=291 /DNA_ID=CAMNT_0015343925 /DNA_START=126 /DNA_END=1001 /DNA_ORIENTATION=+